jgi:hypothetical protein
MTRRRKRSGILTFRQVRGQETEDRSGTRNQESENPVPSKASSKAVQSDFPLASTFQKHEPPQIAVSLCFGEWSRLNRRFYSEVAKQDGNNLPESCVVTVLDVDQSSDFCVM